MSIKCVDCGRFCKDVHYTQNKFTGKIEIVIGTCAKCGKVDLTNADWTADELTRE